MNENNNIENSRAAAEQEQWWKSLPAQVFLNHFFALQLYIKNDTQAYSLQHLPYFQQFKVDLTDQEKEIIRKHLFNSWNTEYTLRMTAQLGEVEYLRHALHWTFPQAYYSVRETLISLLILHDVDIRKPYRIAAESGKLIVRRIYPHVVSFYAVGHAHRPRLYRLPYGKYQPTLELAESEREAQRQIGQFLRTTHRQRALQVRAQVQSNPLTAIRSQKTGKVLQRFDEQHWEQLSWRIGYTTIFDLLTRLHISANHREIDRFVEADIDVELFHKSLLEVVSYLNFVHEAYIAKAVGKEVFQQWIDELPAYLQQDFIRERFDKIISAINNVHEVQPLPGMSA